MNASAIETIEIQPSCTGVPKVLTVCASSCNYTSIQAAINDACPGDTIQVHSGTYNEHVVVNKTLTLQGVDTGSGLPVVDAGDSGDAITISADGCTVEDFKARNSGAWLCAGIHVTSNGNTISGNTLTGNLYGIRLDSSSNNTISGNTATGNIASGIYIYSSSNNTISGNIATGNIASGIDLYRSSGNTISGNTANGNSQCGIRIFGPSTGNSISNNFANGNSWGGIYMTDSSGSAIFGNIVSNNSASGIGISSSSNITISDNTAKDNSQFGIFIFGPSTDNTVSDNTATGNGYHGISLSSSSNGNTISANTITRNSLYGIRLDSSCNGNSIYLNTLDNTNNAWSNGANDWNSTTSITWEHNGRTLTGLLGNIWSGYDGLDCDGDGMGDAPYDKIEGGSEKDYHPIGGRHAGPGLEAEKSADRSEVEVGEWINYTIRLNNTGNVTLTGVRAYDNLTGAAWTVGDLAHGENYTNTTRYRVLLSDLPGPIANELRANGTDPCGVEVNDSAIEMVNITGKSLSCISGKKRNICTGAGIANWTIILKNETGAVINQTTTDTTGGYSFCSLKPGLYQVSEESMPGWKNVSASEQIKELGCDNLTDINFNNEPLYCVFGRVTNSITGAGLPDWELNITIAGRQINTTRTNETGYYQFCNLPTGNYVVWEIMQPHWEAKYQGVHGRGRQAPVMCGNTTDIDFSNIRLLNISGRKINDCTGEGLSSWYIMIFDDLSADDVITNDTGYFQVCNLTPGVWKVYEYAKPGWRNVTDSLIEVNLNDSDVQGLEFRNAPLGCLYGYKLNEGGVGLSGWTIEVRNSSGPVGSAQTDGNGFWQVCNLQPEDYNVSEVLQGNYKAVTPTTVQVTLDNCVNSSPINFTNTLTCCLDGFNVNEKGQGLEGWTIIVTSSNGTTWNATTDSAGHWKVCGLENGTYTVCEVLQPDWIRLDPQDCHNVTMAGENISDLNFINQKTYCMAGQKLNNLTKEPLEGWTITVSNDSKSWQVQTNSTGFWELCGLGGGNYTVCEENRSGWVQVYPVGCYEVIDLAAIIDNSGPITGISFYNEPIDLCLSGHKFHHLTGEGLAGWTIVVNNTTDSWEIVTDANGFWQKCNLTPGQYTVCEVLKPGWTQVSPIDCYDVPLIDKSISGLDFYNNPGCNLTLTKTADKETAKRGENVTYNITLTNPCADQGLCFNNVTLWDVLPNGVQFVSANPAPSSSSATTLYWDIGTFCSGEFKAQIVVRVPIVDINYDMEQGVSGEGFVNVHNDYDTHQAPESITNCAYAEADLQPTISDCVTTKIVDPGTELLRREFGSGDYASEELLRLRTENKSIRSVTSLSAEHKPTSFALPGNRSIDYGTKWTEKSKAINTITGATMTEEYTFAQKIDKERAVDLDKNGSTMKTDVAFTGTGHIGVLKKRNPDSHPRIDPTYEAVEDYTGTFRVYELVDEYGKSVKSEKNVSGYGYVAVDKRVGASQRTYESGTGSYQSDELIETPTNYIAKDIRLVHGPTNYSYSPGFATNQNIKWSEGMWSKSGYLAGGVMLAGNSSCGSLIPTGALKGSQPASLISERYSGLDYLDKETVASGLNEMNTEASFSGTADYKVKAIFSNRSGEIDNEERYVGAYAITRHVQLTGVSRYDRPHITVAKKGKMTKRFFNKTMADVMEYAITITNDGSRSLGPINIRDIFPPGTEYIGSSIRPDSQSNREANWSLLNLGIGGSITLKLELNVTEFAPCSLVNRVMVCGMDGEECAAGAAYHVVECGELPCCPPDLVLDKSAEQEPTDPALIHYTIAVQNKGNSSVAATLKDLLPAGLEFVEASPRPSRQEGQFLEWILPDLEMDGLEVIEYSVRATMDGVYVNSVHMDASAVDGSGYDTADAAAKVEVRSTGVAPRTTRYGDWQVPDWNMTSPDQGITVDLSPEEDLVG